MAAPATAQPRRVVPPGVLVISILGVLVRVFPLGIAGLLTLYGWATRSGGVADYERIEWPIVLGMTAACLVGTVLLVWQSVATIRQSPRSLIAAASAIALADIAVAVWLAAFTVSPPPTFFAAIFVLFIGQLALVAWMVHAERQRRSTAVPHSAAAGPHPSANP